MALLSNIQSHEAPTPNNDVRPELGLRHGWAGSIRGGYKESLTSVGIGLYSRIHAGKLDRDNGLEPVDEDSFVKEYGAPDQTGFEFKADETPTQVELRYQDFIDVQVQSHRAQGIGGVGQFAGGMLGNMASPVDAVLAYVPFAGMAKFAKAASISAKSGQRMSATLKKVEQITSMKKSPLSSAIEAGGKVSTFRIAGELARKGLIEQAVENAAVWGISQEIGRDYGTLDFVADTVLGGGVVGGLSFFGSFRIKNQADIIRRFMTDQTIIQNSIETGDIGSIAHVLERNSREFAVGVTHDKLLVEAMEMGRLELDKSTKHKVRLMEFIKEHEDALWFEQIKALTPRDPNKSIAEALVEQAQTAAKIADAVATGKLENLTPAELDIVLQADANVVDTVANLEGKTEPLEIVVGDTPSNIVEGTEGQLTDPKTGKTWKKPAEGARSTRWNTLRKELDEAAAKVPATPEPVAPKELEEAYDTVRAAENDLREKSQTLAQEEAYLADLEVEAKIDGDYRSVEKRKERIESLKEEIKQVEKTIKEAQDKIDAPVTPEPVASKVTPKGDPAARLVAAQKKVEKELGKPIGGGKASAQQVRVLDELLSLKQDVARRQKMSTDPKEKRSLGAEEVHLNVLTEIAQNPDDVTALRKAFHRLEKIINKSDPSRRSYSEPAMEIMRFEHQLLTKFLENRNVDDILPLIRERYGIKAPEPVAPKVRPNIGQAKTPDSVVLKYATLKGSMAVVRTNKETGEKTIILDSDQIRKDWDNGMQYLLGLVESKGSKQKQKVFENVDVAKLREVLKDAEGYERFILEHEKAHVFHESAHYSKAAKEGGLMSPEALAAETAANQYAAEKLGFDWASVEKTPSAKVPVGPQKPDLNAQSQKLDQDLRANQEENVRAAEARREQKRKKVENSAKLYTNKPTEGYARNMDRIKSLTTTWLPWLSYRGTSYGDETQKLKDYLITLLDDPEADFSNTSVKQLLKLVDRDKLDYKADVMLGLLETKERHAKARSVGVTFFRNFNPDTLANVDPSNIGEDFAREIRRLSLLIETTDLTPADASRQYADMVTFQESGELLRKLHNESVQRRHDRQLEGKTEKQKLKYFKSFLDGLNRVGVNLRGSSVQDSINAQITLSQAPLLQVLVKHKMMDAFLDPNDMLIKDLMAGKRTGKTPDHWKGETEVIFKELLEVYKMTNDSLIAELNYYGANIMHRSDHSGVSHRWDGSTMAARGFEEWRTDMIDNIDWEAVEINLGGVLVGKRNQFNFAQDFVGFDRDKYLKAMWEELTGPKSEIDHPSMDISASFGKHRNIVIKPESEIAMMKKYSGHDNMGQLYLDQIRYRAEMVAVARELGNNPIPNYQQAVKDAGLVEGINTTRKATGFGGKLHDWDMTTMDWTLSQLTGRLDNPVDVDVSRYAKTVRQVSHILYLWTSGVSAITDIPLTISTLQSLGVTNSTSALLSAFSRSFKRRLLDEGDVTRQFYTSMGANFDAMKNAASRHMGLPDGKTAGSLVSKAAEAMFNYNLLNAWTGVMQEAFFDVLSRELAEGIHAGKLDPNMARSMAAAGITEADLLNSGAITNVNGVDRFDIHKLGDDDMVRKTMAFFSKYRDEAIMMPDASTQAMIRGGQRAGTLKGEAMRTLLQYQAFPLAMNRVTARKFLVNAEGGRPWTTEQVTFSSMIGFIGGMLAMAYVSTVIKDLLRGREPMHMGNMTANSWIRIVNQSGVGGLLQSIMEVGSGNPKALLAPLPSDALKIAGSDSFGEAIYRSRNIWSGGNNPAAPIIQKAVASIFPDMVGIHFKMLNAYHEQNTGQSPLFWAP